MGANALGSALIRDPRSSQPQEQVNDIDVAFPPEDPIPPRVFGKSVIILFFGEKQPLLLKGETRRAAARNKTRQNKKQLKVHF